MDRETVEITVSVPASLADAGAAERARVLLVLDAVRSDRMSFRAATHALGIAPDRLLDLAREHGAPVVTYEPRDLDEDMSTLAKLDSLRSARG